MSDSCSSVPESVDGVGTCPRSGSDSDPVDWLTVASLVRGRVPARQEFWLCRDPGCEVVYVGSTGIVLTAEDLRVVPGFKDGSNGLVCYCFLHHEGEIEAEIADTGETAVFDSITAEITAGNCACEVRNPSGKCCLGEVKQTINQIKQRLGVAR